LTKAYHSIKTAQSDPLQLKKLTSIAFQNYKLGDTILFKTRTSEALDLATKHNDSFAMGDAHWNFASYYNQKEVYDRAYYHFNTAAGIFEKNGHNYESAKMQYGMSFIKGRFKDYSGSEVLAFLAIKKFKKLENYEELFSCYNHIGSLQIDIYEYDKALFYFGKAIDNLKKVKNNRDLKDAIINNIGNTYLRKGDYQSALQNFNVLLKNDRLKQNNKKSYARTLDNKAFCKLLMKDTLHVSSSLNEALRIRDSLDNKSGILISKIHLARYYTYAQDNVKAIRVAKEANRLADEIKNSRDYLESLFILANLDPLNSKTYLKRHIEYSDSLQIIERKIQNKFTRIAFETDEYIEETERLEEQKIWILITVLGLILIVILLLSFWIQKSKNKNLLFEYEQQKANEEVYLISLKQQEKLEAEKIKERNRISEELHDGVLGKLFGTRMNLGFLELKGNKNILEQHQEYLNELQTIEKEIRNVSHKLNDNTDSTQVNFSNIIKEVLESKSKLGNFEYSLEIDESINWFQINEVCKINLFRIVQEALHNVLKHAFAKKVTLIFMTDKKNLVLKIKDDGIGYNIHQRHKGIGIKNIESRIKKLNGVLNISSKQSEGTTLTIKIPKK